MPQVGLTKSAAQELLKDYSNKIDEAMSGEYAIDLIESKLVAQLQEIEKMTQQAFSLLGYTGTIEANEKELSVNVKLAQSETASLNGNQLEENFIRRFKSVDPFKMDLQKQYDTIMEMLKRETYGTTFFATEEERAATMFMNIMQNMVIQSPNFYITVEGSSKIREKSSGKLVGYQYGSSYARLGKKAKDNITKFLNDKGNIIKLKKFEETYENDKMTLSWLLENIDVESFLKMEPEERSRVLKAYPGLLEQINKIYTNAIIDSCPAADKSLLRKSIEEVLKEKDTAFFVGGSITQLTGILGEIQGIYIFKRIVKNNSKRTKVGWVGGINNPHADLILTAALGTFGIQVKNKSYDQAKSELMNIEFKNFNQTKNLIDSKGSKIEYSLTSEALSAASELGISAEIFDAIQSALAADTFNVYYKWNPKTKQAESVESNEEFVDVRSLIETYARKSEKIMSLYSAALMYMQATAITPSNPAANTFYLVAGATVVSAATIMSTIVKELRDAMNTHFRAEVKTGHKNNKTIIDVLNSGRKQSKTSVINFVLQSSYNF